MRPTAFTAALLALAALVVASPAQAGSAGPQQLRRPPAKMPVDFPGRQYKRGERIPRGHVMVSRRITLDSARDSFTFRLTCPRGTGIASLAFEDPGEVGFQLVRPLRYRARRQVVLRAEGVRGYTPEGGATDTIYLLCRR